jgi:alpha-1,3-glucosyltransferase
MLTQLASRLFPFQRGLCHAYWAPNVWALYNVLDKVALVGIKRLGKGKLGGWIRNENTGGMTGGLVQEASHAVLPPITPMVCAVLQLLAMAPVLVKMWRWPTAAGFGRAVCYCMMCSFMLGYHVHEKHILQVLIPLSLVACDSPSDARLYLLLSWVAHFSLFPLLFTMTEAPLKLLMYLAHSTVAYYALSSYFSGNSDSAAIDSTKGGGNAKRGKASRSSGGGGDGGEGGGVRIYSLEWLYIFGLVVVMAFDLVIHPVFFRAAGSSKGILLDDSELHLPFLPLMLISVYCAVGGYC